MNASKILLRDEIAQVLADLKQRAKRSVIARQNLIIFRLSCCCGLRRKEIAGLKIFDLVTAGPRPCLRVRKEITKRACKRKAKDRIVPLWWDAGTLQDLSEWKTFRVQEGVLPDAPLVYVQLNRWGTRGYPMHSQRVALRWQTAIACLGKERVRQLSIHCGRHSFCSHALAAGRTLPEVRDAAGHANDSTTSIYLHVVLDDKRVVPDVFEL